MQKDLKFHGVYPPTITSFDADGKFSPEKQKNAIDFLLDNGVDGLWVLGSYGAFALLSTEERKQVAEFFVKEVNGRVPIIMQIGCPSTQESIELAKHSQGIGAEAVGTVVPYYFAAIAYRDDDIVKHFAKLVESVDIPVFLYNNMRTTGFDVSPKLLKKLADVGVVGLKDSSGSHAQMSEYINTVQPDHPDFVFFSGSAALLLPTLMLGGQGAVTGTGNAFPEIVRDVYQLFKAGKLNEASEVQNLVLKVRMLQGFDGFRPSSCYAMLRLRGVDAGFVRPPWREMPQSVVDEVGKQLKKLNLI